MHHWDLAARRRDSTACRWIKPPAAASGGGWGGRAAHHRDPAAPCRAPRLLARFGLSRLPSRRGLLKASRCRAVAPRVGEGHHTAARVGERRAAHHQGARPRCQGHLCPRRRGQPLTSDVGRQRSGPPTSAPPGPAARISRGRERKREIGQRRMLSVEKGRRECQRRGRERRLREGEMRKSWSDE